SEKMLEDVPTDEDKELIHEILDEAEEITEDEELINKIEEIREEVDQIEDTEQIDDETATIIFQQKLDELVSQYGVFEAEQSGFMQWASDKWLDPSGILSATILDFDSDGALEMLVCISEECPHQAMDYDYVSHQYHISMEVYEIENGMAVNLCSTLFGAYTESEYSSDNQDEVGFDEEMANNEYISANIFEINEEYFIVCEAKSVYFAFTIGQWQSYWIMKYNGVEFQYVGSLTQTAGGNGGYEYTAYSFDNGLAVIDTLYYSEQNEHSGDALYNSIREAVRAFFGTYDIDTSDFIIDYENADDGACDLQSTFLRSNNITEAFTFTNSEINFNYDASANIGTGEYLANLSRGNDLLNIF
ncbi:MAG: hypothetical protein LUH07_07365, partial [Lachnospiraceae bacterium]|nr:hypothetical protein [Lachnospiraceae bacterium]